MTTLTKRIWSLIFNPQPSQQEQTPKDTVTLSPKQATILAVLQTAETPLHARQRLQKYVFLIDESLGDKYSLYKWRPYDYGPYSKSLKHDVNRLERKDLIIIDRRQTLGGNTRRYYHLSDAGANVLDDVLGHEDDFSKVVDHVEDVINKHDDIPLSNLMWDVIEDYPEYNKTVYKP